MALFIGGPADGWRIDVDTAEESIVIPVNPHPPAFTPDKAVLETKTIPGYKYIREEITCGVEDYFVYIPADWNCADLVDALILGYKPEKDKERQRYIRTANGQLYDNDDYFRTRKPRTV